MPESQESIYSTRTEPGDARTVPWRPLVISAPFGNYIQPAGCTATLGTFTAMPRGGRVPQILKTVRYYPRIKAWVNKIGLRNPGIAWLQQKVEQGKIDVSDKLVSVHGFDETQWIELIDKAAALEPLGIELNMSCPNVGEVSWPVSLFARAAELQSEAQGQLPGAGPALTCGASMAVIVKLPPVNFRAMADAAVAAGLTRFHCCNTLPVPAGGVSGGPLKPVAMQCIAQLRAAPYGDAIHILAGGGIRTPDDIDDYRGVGADTFAVGTKVMNPWYLMSHGGLAPLRERATGVSLRG